VNWSGRDRLRFLGVARHELAWLREPNGMESVFAEAAGFLRKLDAVIADSLRRQVAEAALHLAIQFAGVDKAAPPR
jgi:hypothetical protein